MQNKIIIMHVSACIFVSTGLLACTKHKRTAKRAQIPI